MRKIVFFIFISFSSVFAQSAGNTGLSFLKLGFGARNIAMGDVGAAASGDVTSLFYNPANLINSSTNEIMLMHNSWIQGINSEVLGVKTNIWGLPVAAGFNVTTINNIEVRTGATAVPDAMFNANYFFGSLSTAFNTIDNLAFGITLKYLYEGLYVDEATGYGLDLGLNYTTPINGLTAVAVVNNLGSMNKLKNEKTKLPSDFRVGPAYKFYFWHNTFEVTAAAELQKYIDTNDLHTNWGLEIVYDDLLALRGGYQTGYQSKGMTAGMGIMWGTLSFDYAFQPFSEGLGSANIFSLQFKF